MPGVEAGVACKGTALVRPKELRLKLSASLPEATKLAAKHPERYAVGSLGWVKITIDDVQPPKPLEKSIAESYEVVGGSKR